MARFDWPKANETLLAISLLEVEDFLASQRSRDVYGMGYFCHNSYGDVLLVANVVDYRDHSYRDYCLKFGKCSENEFMWQIGNWKYPAGIAEGIGQRSEQYRKGWSPFRQLSDSATMAGDIDHPGPYLRQMCCDVLGRLIRAGAFQAYPQLAFTVLDVDDQEAQGWKTKLEFDEFVRQLKS